MRKSKWFLFVIASLIVTGLGLVIGEIKGRDPISQLYQRNNFRLLDDQNEIFELKKISEEKRLLLIFLPDQIFPHQVVPFATFSRNAETWRSKGVECYMIARINMEIAKNFKKGAGFNGPILSDPSGSVGKITGHWPTLQPVEMWGYSLIDRNFQIIWQGRSPRVLTADEVWEKISNK